MGGMHTHAHARTHSVATLRTAWLSSYGAPARQGVRVILTDAHLDLSGPSRRVHEQRAGAPHTNLNLGAWMGIQRTGHL